MIKNDLHPEFPPTDAELAAHATLAGPVFTPRYGSTNDELVEAARQMRAAGASLFAIAQAIGRSKEWLRTYAGLSDR